MKVCVLTIDPAKRLADSLGLKELGNEAKRVEPELFAAQGVEIKGELWAMMLDAKVTFDELVDQSVTVRLDGPDRIAAEDHPQRLLDADQARQPQRSAGARNDAELDFGKPESRAGRGDAEMAGERYL